MKITIITVCFNSAETIADTLRSVAEQRYSNVEHIVIDGASSDNTLEIISSTPNRVTRLISETDRGIYDAMNKGLALATGDVIGFLNSDDKYVDEDCLDEIASSFKDEKVDACYGDVRFVAARDSSRTVRYWRAGHFRSRGLERGWMPPHPTFYARRTVYQRVGEFNIDYRLQADYELAIRMLRGEKLRMRYLERCLVIMRMGGASNASVGNVIRGNLEAYRAAKKHNLSIGPFFIVRKILSRVPQFFFRPDSTS